MEPNDTLLTATSTSISTSDFGAFTFNGQIGNNPGVAPDVDLYALELDQSTQATFDINTSNLMSIDSILFFDSILTIFDAEGNELAVNDQSDGNDSFIDFNPQTTGTYYVGVSGYSNFDYNPEVAGSGNTFLANSIGNYNLVITTTAPNTIVGNDNNNVLNGTAGIDVISGLDGNDVIRGRGGNDTIRGGRDNDTLFGDSGDDSILGGRENDRLFGDGGNDNLQGERGNDRLFGGGGNDSLLGGRGNDRLSGEGGDDSLLGGSGNDELRGGSGQDELRGGSGRDILIGGQGDDNLTGSIGNDDLTGGGNRDRFVIAAGDGIDTITDFGGVGTGINPTQAIIDEVDTLEFFGSGLTPENMLITKNGPDLEIDFEGVDETKVILQNFNLEDLDNLTTENSASVTIGNILFDGQIEIEDSFDVFNATDNRARVFNRNTVTFLNNLDNNTSGFSNSDDVINGQGGDDLLTGLSGNDILRGGSRLDTLKGGRGDDILVGGTGQDVLEGGPGDDTLVGGRGSDILVGGDGADTFIFGADLLVGEDQLVGEELLDELNDLRVSDSIVDFQSQDVFDFSGYLDANVFLAGFVTRGSLLRVELSGASNFEISGDSNALDVAQSQVSSFFDEI